MKSNIFVLKQREKVFAVITGVLLFSLFWVQFILQPIWDMGKKQDVDFILQNVKLREVKKALSKNSSQLAVKDSLKRFSSDESSQVEMASLIKEIETAAASAGLRVLETKPQPYLKNAGRLELKVNFSFEGRLSDIVQFLYQLQENPKPLLVNEMTLESTFIQQETIRGQLEIGRLFVMKS